MNKILNLITLFIFLIFLNDCAGYKPIFKTSNLEFQIVDYSIKGDKVLGRQIYSQLYNLSKSNKNNVNAQEVDISIEISKDKIATTKSNTGKILQYKITLNTRVIVNNYITKNNILNQTFTSFTSYQVQSRHSETIQLENTSIENLINKTYQDLLIILSQKISVK